MREGIETYAKRATTIALNCILTVDYLKRCVCLELEDRQERTSMLFISLQELLRSKNAVMTDAISFDKVQAVSSSLYDR